jgi:dipeptidyl aminopeptidase/acylaminoacyl peptidase
VSPDGRTVAFVVERVDMDAACYRSAIWLATADGSSPPAQFSAGAEHDDNPAWSPDGRRLAFTRSESSAGGSGDDAASRHQLLVAPVEGPGEVVTVASSKHEGFGDVAWSPDGRLLVYTQRVRAERYEPDDDGRKRRRGPVSRPSRAGQVGEIWTPDSASRSLFGRTWADVAAGQACILNRCDA